MAWACRTHPPLRMTPGSTIAYGPTTTSSASSAPGSTIAAACTRAIVLPLAVDDAREKIGARAERAVDRRLAAKLPYVRAVVGDRDFEIQPIAGRDDPTELRLVDAEEVHERARRVERLGRVGKDPPDLREGF